MRRDIVDEISQNHKVAFYHLILITEGKGVHTIDFIDYKYDKGDIITIRKDQIHNFDINLDVKGYILLFTDEFLLSHFSAYEINVVSQLFNEHLYSPHTGLNEENFDMLTRIAIFLEREYSRYNGPLSNGILRSTLQVIILNLLRIKGSETEEKMQETYVAQFIRFQELLRENCLSIKKVADYARMLNCSTKTLSNITNRLIKKSAKQFIDDEVVLQIKRMLLNSDMTATEIAYASGFEDPSYLFKYFKKQTGLSPDAFRKASK